MSDWPAFTERLGQVLADLANGNRSGALVLADVAQPECLVQFLWGGDSSGIWAETASNKFRPEHRQLSESDEAALDAAGWDKPGGKWWQPNNRIPNWSRDDFGDPDADFHRLAELTVAVFRDIDKLETSAALGYKVFYDDGVVTDLPALQLVRLE